MTRVIRLTFWSVVMNRLLGLILFAPAASWAAFTPGYTIMSDLQDFEVFPNSGFVQTRERAIRIDTP